MTAEPVAVRVVEGAVVDVLVGGVVVAVGGVVVAVGFAPDLGGELAPLPADDPVAVDVAVEP